MSEERLVPSFTDSCSFFTESGGTKSRQCQDRHSFDIEIGNRGSLQ